jgi:hypothetical protein
MKLLRLWMVAAGLSGVLSLASVAQGAGADLQTPSKASVIAEPSRQLVPGQSFKFILRFDRAPRGYGVGQILYKFQMMSRAQPDTEPEGDKQILSQSTELVNDSAEYRLSLLITHSMVPGIWKLTEVTIVGGIPHPIPIQENVTFKVLEPTSPIRATVSWDKSQRLEDGETFDWELRLETAPEGYDAGQIPRLHYRFELIKPDPQEARSSGITSSAEGFQELRNGQSIYKLSVPVIQLKWVEGGGRMVLSQGKWRLAEVTLGQRVMKPVSIQEEVTFEVHAHSIVLHVQAPGSVRAGQQFGFKVSVDGYPANYSCNARLTVYLRQRPPDGQPKPGDLRVVADSIPLDPKQSSYEMSGLLPPDDPDGPWQGEFEVYAVPGDPQNPWAPPPSPASCSRLDLEGDTRFAFTVEPAVGLVTPTSVAVTVNLSQGRLLLAEAKKLKAKAQHLKQQLNSENTAANLVILRSGLTEAMNDVDATEARYEEEAEKGRDEPSRQAVSDFFDEIRSDYRETQKVLANVLAKSHKPGPQLLTVSAAVVGTTPRLTQASAAVFKTILHTAKAFEVVAATKSMYFNLDVFSDPKGANISYHQPGKEYHNLDHETDWRIENLRRGVYRIRLQKQGFEDNEVEFDAMDNTSTSINIPLKPKSGAQ